MASDLRDNIATEARRIEEDSLHSAKGHFAAAERWHLAHYWIGFPLALLSAVTGVLVIADKTVVATILAFGVALLTAATTFFNPSGRASKHLSAGNGYKRIQNRARRLHQLHCADTDLALAALRKTADDLGGELDDLNEQSPKIPTWAYQRALAAIAAGEATYAADKNNA